MYPPYKDSVSKYKGIQGKTIGKCRNRGQNDPHAVFSTAQDVYTMYGVRKMPLGMSGTLLAADTADFWIRGRLIFEAESTTPLGPVLIFETVGL